VAPRLGSLSRALPGLVSRSISQRPNVLKPFHTATPLHAEMMVRHVKAEHNNPDQKWDFTRENHEKIENLLKKYPKKYRRSGTIPLLHMAQEQNGGWIPLAAMNRIAAVLEIPAVRVYEVATFYTMFVREPIGTHHIQMCCTTPCMIEGAYDVMDAIQKFTGCTPGHSSPDGLFHITEVECLGACVNAPMFQIDGPTCQNNFYENLTPETAVKVLQILKDGGVPKIGPQYPTNRGSTTQKSAAHRHCRCPLLPPNP